MPNNELIMSFMGGTQITLGADDLTASLPTKAQALLCYAVLSRRTLRRQEVVGMFWGNSTEERARTSLRVALRRMNEQGLEPFLNPTRHMLTFRWHTQYRCDVEAFEQLLRNADVGNGRIHPLILQQALDLYRGDFLHGFDLLDAPDFDLWMLAQRERFRQMALTGLDALIANYIEENQFNLGITAAHRLLELDPWRESGHRQLMWLFASNGQRAAAMTQYEKCREILLNELGLEPDSETVTLAQEIQSTFQTASRPFIPLPPVPELDNETAVPFQPPHRHAYFVGRQSDLAHLTHLLADSSAKSNAPRFCLTGMGGVGKTALAIALAHQLRPHFKDGVLWATVVSTNLMEIAENWAHAYGYDFTGLHSLEERTAALRSLLAQKQLLIVLDDVTVAAVIRPLLPTTGSSVTLITSRQVNIAQRLNARQITLNELTPQSSYQLLAKHIGEHRVAQEVTFAQEICILVGHLPLAIALVGTYLAHRPYRLLEQFVGQLQVETSRLSIEGAGGGVHASMTISWQSLDKAQQDVFCCLAVFAGRDLSLAAMAYILDLDVYQAQDALEDLVRFSLLQNNGRLRYRQHRLLADFAQEKLGVGTKPLLRMAQFYLQFATENRADYLAYLPEWGNLDAAIAFAIAFREWEMVLQFTAVLHDAWFARGRYSEARQAFAHAETAAFALENEEALAHNWFLWGQASLEQSDYAQSVDKLQKSLTLYHELGDEKGVAEAQLMLARIALVRADYAAAEQLLQASQTIAKKRVDFIGVAATCYQLARLANSLGDYERGQQLCETAVSHYQTINDKSGLIPILRLYALILVNLGQYLHAKEKAEMALQLAEQAHIKSEKAVVLSNLASIERNLGNIEVALHYAQESLDLLIHMGDRRSQAIVIYRQLLIYQDSQQYDHALDAGNVCLSMFREFGDLRQIALTLTHMGNIYELLEDTPQAIICWFEALELAEMLDHKILKPHLQEKLHHAQQ